MFYSKFSVSGKDISKQGIVLFIKTLNTLRSQRLTDLNLVVFPLILFFSLDFFRPLKKCCTFVTHCKRENVRTILFVVDLHIYALNTEHSTIPTCFMFFWRGHVLLSV